MEPDDHDPPQDREFHGMHVMRYGDYWLGFLQVYHVLHEGWYAFREMDADAPAWMETWSLQLTFSRDGRTWHRAGNRQTFMSGSGSDAFDSRLVAGVHQPFVHDEQVWFYYHGFPYRHIHTEQERLGIHSASGLAQLRLDGFVSIDAEGRGTYTSGRLDMIPSRIEINASARGVIRVEALDPFCRPITDFTVEQAAPFQGDALHGEVAWKHGRNLAQITEQLLGGIRLRFYLDDAKLYSFTIIRES